jgi:trk system potassium uptake protein TrkA
MCRWPRPVPAAPELPIERTLADAALRSTYGVTVVAIKRPGEAFNHTTADTVVYASDILIVAGGSRSVQAFANLR